MWAKLKSCQSCLFFICVEAPRDCFWCSCVVGVAVLATQTRFSASLLAKHISAKPPPAASCVLPVISQKKNPISLQSGKRDRVVRHSRWERGGILMQKKKNPGVAHERGMQKDRGEPRFPRPSASVSLFSPLDSEAEEGPVSFTSPRTFRLPTASRGSLISRNWRDGFFKTTL